MDPQLFDSDYEMSESREDEHSMFQNLLRSLGSLSLPGSRCNTPPPNSSANTSPTSKLSPMSRHSTIRATLFGSSASQVTSQPTLWADRCKLEDISSLHSPALGKYRTRPSHQITKRIKEQIHSHCSTIIHVNHRGCSSGCQPACEVEEHRPRIEVCIMSKRGTAASEHDLT